MPGARVFVPLYSRRLARVQLVQKVRHGLEAAVLLSAAVTPLRDPSHADAVLGAVNVVVATPAPMQVSPI